MKITFLVPPALDNKLPAERVFGCNYGIYSQANIFMLYPATVLQKADYDVVVKDCVAERMNKDSFIQYIKKDDSAIYVFYTVFLSKNTDLSARELIREHRPQTKFIYLATEPSSHPGDFVAADTCVIRGESEEIICELVSVLEKEGDLKNIAGVSFLCQGKVANNPPRQEITELDVIPFPDRDLIDSNCYHNPKLSKTPATTMVTSRGCAYSCYYCVPNSLSFAREIEHRTYSRDWSKPPVRLRSSQNVIAEFGYLHQKGYKAVSVLDDQFVWNTKRALDICAGIERYNFEWCCLARADHVNNEDLVAAMAAAGCRYVDIGVESFIPEILEDIKKDMDIKSVYESVQLLKKYGIEQELNILLGSSPLETEETIAYTLEQVKKLDVDYVLFSICTPFPCTEFNAIAKEKGWMIEPEYRAIDPIKESFVSYPNLSKEKLETIIRRAYYGFYFRPGYIWKRMRQIEDAKDLLNKIKAALSILR